MPGKEEGREKNRKIKVRREEGVGRDVGGRESERGAGMRRVGRV